MLAAKRMRRDGSQALSSPSQPFVEDYAPYSKRQIDVRFEQNHSQNWDTFYRNNDTKGYKDRHYITREFPELREALQNASAKGNTNGKDEMVTLLEAGCGVGNTFFPLLDAFQTINFSVAGFDISKVAIDLAKQVAAEKGITQRVRLEVCDLASHAPSTALSPPSGSSFASLVFVLCSVEPSRHPAFLTRLVTLMKTGGILFFRDYCKDDMAEHRFISHSSSPMAAGASTYARSNGTLSHFFSIEEVEQLMLQAGLATIAINIVERDVENRKQGISMTRRWVQGRFRKL